MKCSYEMNSVRSANAIRRQLAPCMRCGCHGGIHFASGFSSSDEQERASPSWHWYRIAYARLLRLAGSLRDVEHADGGLQHAMTGRAVMNACAIAQMACFAELGAQFVAPLSPLKHVKVSSLTTVCDILGVSAQRRKTVRLTICRQVTQHHVWRGALEELLKDLQSDIRALERQSSTTQMANQIASACICFLSGTADTATSVSPSWMRPTPFKKPAQEPPPARTWQEMLAMFMDLAKTLATEARLAGHAAKIEAAKEGLHHIRDIVVERDIGFKEAHRQDCLVRRNLSNSLGHSSRCLFMLLLYYLYGTVRDVEAHVCKQLPGEGDKTVTVHAAKFLTSSDESAVRSGARELSRALGVFRFVWDAANAGTGIGTAKGAAANGTLELRGHLWGLGVEEKTMTYRGHVFSIHEIRLR